MTTEELCNNPFLLLPMPRRTSRPESTPSSPTFNLNRPARRETSRSLKTRASAPLRPSVSDLAVASSPPKKSPPGSDNSSRNNSVKKKKKFDFVRHLRRFNTAKSMEDFDVDGQRSSSLLRDANDLFEAVEQGELSIVKDILSRRPLLRNCVNDLQLSPLDMAMLRGQLRIVQLLLSQDAMNNPRLVTCMERHLVELSHQSADQIVTCTARFLSGSSGAGEAEDELRRLEGVHYLVQQLLTDLRATPPPGPPTTVTLEVSGHESIKITVNPPPNCCILRYRIEWSNCPTFNPLSGSREVEVRLPKAVYQIHKLVNGVPVYVRVSALNLTGWGRPRLSHPSCCIPSSWWQNPGCSRRPIEPSPDSLAYLDSEYACEMVQWLDDGRGSKSPLRKRTSFQRLFSGSGSKFVRRPRSGLFLTTVFYCDDKVLLNEDSFLHISVDNDGSLAASMNTDLAWLARLVANAPNVKHLLGRLEKLNTPSSLSLRIKLLAAVQNFQDSLGTLDVGHMYPVLFQDSVCTCIVLVRGLTSQREILVPSGFKWTSVYKLHRKHEKNSESSNPSVDDDLVASVHDLLSYSNNCFQPCAPGLYLSYMKLHSTFDSVHVVVNSNRQCMLPNVRLRDNSHVTKNEWSFLKDCVFDYGKEFHQLVNQGVHDLADQLDLSDEERNSLRIYTAEVIHMSPRTATILVFPPDICCGPGSQPNTCSVEGLCTVPLPTFDLSYFTAFAEHWYPSFASLSASLEVMLAAAQHEQRQAFSENEVNVCKDRVRRLANIQTSLEELYKPVRWSLSVINSARDRQQISFVPVSQLEQLLSCNHSKRTSASDAILESFSSSGCSSLSSVFPSPLGQLTPPPPARSRRKGTIKVTAGYSSGLAEGTSVTLQISAQTTAREVVHLVIGQLNKALIAVDPAAPYYPPSEFDLFSLVVSADGLERPLPADFHPLMLQPPWQDGKITVKHNADLSPTQQATVDSDSGIIDL